MGCCSAKEESETQRKIAVVGDSGVGKTSLIQRLMTDEFDENTPQEYIASSLKVDEKLIELKKGKKVRLFIYDTGGQETFKHLRKLNYPKSDAVVICFRQPIPCPNTTQEENELVFSCLSVDDPETLENVTKNWVPEMQRLCPGIPMLLVGNKVDLRRESPPGQNLIKVSKGQSTANKHRMVGYLECSAKTEEKVKDVFDKIAQVASQRKVVRKEEA